MRIFINILSIIILLGGITGFIIKSSDPKTGDVIIGLSILIGAFILMPSFIIYRARGKKFKDYMLTNENLKRMKEFQKEPRKKD